MMTSSSCKRFVSRSNATRRLKTIAAIVALGCHLPLVHAQTGGSGGTGSGRAFSIVPSFSVNETFTDNVRLSGANPQSEQVTDVSAGFRLLSNTARLRAYVDYALHGLVYAQNTSTPSIQNALTAFGSLEAVENWAFIDFNASISRQAISALGAQSLNNESLNGNITETSATRLSPYLRGKFGSFADYEARYSASKSSSKSNLASDVNSQVASVRLGSGSGSGPLGWSVDASRQLVDNENGRRTEANIVRGGLTYVASPQLRFTVNAGTEANNYNSLGKESSSTSGYGADWSLSDRTTLSASRQQHNYGESHSINFQHRTGRTAWSFSDTRSVSNGSGQGSGSIGSTYDLLFGQFAVIEPDPVKRAQLVSDFLQTNGIDPNTQVISGFLSAATTLQRTQNLSFTLLGVRDTLTFTASRSENARLDTISNAADDLSNSNVVRQRGFSISLAHRLTPDSSVNAVLAQQDSSGTAGVPGTSLRSANLNLSTRVGLRTTASLGARRVVFDSSTAPYAETAVTGNLNMQF